MDNLELQQFSRDNYICSQRKPRLNLYTFTPLVKNLQWDSFSLFFSRVSLELHALLLLNSSFCLTKYLGTRILLMRSAGEVQSASCFFSILQTLEFISTRPLRREQEQLAQSSLSSHLQLKITFSGLWWSLWTNNCPQLLFISTSCKKIPFQPFSNISLI